MVKSVSRETSDGPWRVAFEIARKQDDGQTTTVEPVTIVTIVTIVATIPVMPAWAWKKRRGSPADSAFRGLTAETVAEIDAAILELESGDIDAREFGDLVFGSLTKGHVLSWMLGRQRSGASLDGLSESDIEAGLSLADRHGEFLLGLVDDLANGDARYVGEDGSLRASAVRNRAMLYARAMRGTANEAFVEHGPSGAEYDWVLGLTERHCEDCPLIASRSPYTADANVGHPGDGSTDCLGNCLCVWRRRSDGRTGFAPVRE